MAKVTIQESFQFHLIKCEQIQVIVPCESTAKKFHLNGHTKQFEPHSPKLESPYRTSVFTVVVKAGHI